MCAVVCAFSILVLHGQHGPGVCGVHRHNHDVPYVVKQPLCDCFQPFHWHVPSELATACILASVALAYASPLYAQYD